MTNVLELYQNINPAGRVTNKGGGEYCGPCPRCGGRDRLVLWPTHPSGAVGGRFLCRGCGAQGDAIEFLRVFRGLGYREACEELRVEPRRNEPHIRNSTAREEWTPEPERLPSAGWSKRAAAFVAECRKNIMSGEGHDYLLSRGLNNKTARTYWIGWNPSDRFEPREAWGLPPALNEQGNSKKIALPRGLVLPVLRRNGPVAVVVRWAGWTPESSYPKYRQIVGGSNGLFCLGRKGLPVVIYESAIDALITLQAADDIVAAVATLGTSKRPDTGTDGFLRAARAVLWSMDFDEAGKKAWSWWRSHYPGTKPWFCASGKDLGEQVQAGIPVRAWVQAGLEAVEEDARQDDGVHSLPGDDTSPASVLSNDTIPHETPMPESERAQGEQEDTTACPQYPTGCFICHEYRGLTRWWCRRIHWWMPWIAPEGELPEVTICRGHVWHTYADGTTRFVGNAHKSTVPASTIPPVPAKGSAMTKGEAWHAATRGTGCRS